jgi:pyruvate-formate lyase-activating enzyme
LIKDITDTDKNINSIVKFINEIDEAIAIEYVNYNPLTPNNYDKLGITFLYNAH